MDIQKPLSVVVENSPLWQQIFVGVFVTVIGGLMLYLVMRFFKDD